MSDYREFMRTETRTLDLFFRDNVVKNGSFMVDQRLRFIPRQMMTMATMMAKAMPTRMGSGGIVSF